MSTAYPEGLTCATCAHPLYPRLARRTDDGWTHSDPRVCVAAQRAEDLRWMAETGESLTGAARRVGLTRGSLERWLREQDMRDVRTKLLAREPFAAGWQNQHGAVA